MRKISCFAISFILILSTLFAQVQAIVSDDTADFGYAFSNVGKYILDDYNNGKFGDEIYYLGSFGGWGGRGDVAIFLKNSVATIVLYQSWGRYKERKLNDEEYNGFISFIQGNEVDELPDWDTHMVSDGIEYEYLHFTKDKKAAVYINNPGVVEEKDDKIYSSLVSQFWNLTESEDFDVRYDIDDAEILIKNEDYKVQSVWKDGDDFRVLIKDEENSTYDYEKLDWYKFDMSKVTEKIGEPADVYMQDSWSDDPGTHPVGIGDNSIKLGGFSMQQYSNNYPWQVSWNGYRVRVMRSFNDDYWGEGIWLNKQSEAPILIQKGLYGYPVVIPDTDWVVCEKAENGWQNPRKLVRIDLKTFVETDIDLPPSDDITPEVFINGRLLISRTTKDAYETYMYDATTDSLEKVYGDFNCLFDLRGRFLQKSSEPNKFFALGNQHTIGIFDAKEYTFTEIAKYSTIIYDNDHMWVDEEKGRVYVVVNEDLISLPINTSINYDNEIKVLVNERPIVFDQPPVMQEDRVLVPMRKVFEALGANVSWSQEEQLIVAFKGQKIILIKMGSKDFVVIDTSGYNTYGDFFQAIYGESMKITDNPSFDFSSISQKYQFDVLPQIINERTLIPVRAVSEALGVGVDWDGEKSSVMLSCDKTLLSERNKDSEFINILFFYEEFFK